MNLLFVTRKIDTNDPRTGFVKGWQEKFAESLKLGKGKLHIIALEKSDFSSEWNNVFGESIREDGKNRFFDLFRYLKLLFKIIPNTDAVFIHQHPAYAIVAAPIVRLFNLFSSYRAAPELCRLIAYRRNGAS